MHIKGLKKTLFSCFMMLSVAVAAQEKANTLAATAAATTPQQNNYVLMIFQAS